MNTKGGMAANPFGGRVRLDLIDLVEFRVPNQPAEMVLFLECIKDSVFNYLFFALGRNGTSLDEFWWAMEYLFRVRSFDPTTWQGAKSARVTTVDKRSGKRSVRFECLNDETVRMMCFDIHYELSGLARLMSMDRFLAGLKFTRRQIVRENRSQIDKYIDEFRERQLENIARGWRIPITFADAKREELMVQAEDGAELADLFFYESRLSIPPDKPDLPQTCAPIWEIEAA
jgi:hypothetical protein